MEFLFVDLVKWMVKDHLVRDRICVVDFLLLVRVGFPGFWHGRLEAFLRDIEQISILLKVHPQELSIANDF